MRFAPRTLFLGLALAAVAASDGCLFSTNPPKPNSSGGSGSSDPNTAVVTGAVQFYDRTDHHTRNMPDWIVRADWYIRTGTGLRLERRSLVRSNRSGVYEVQFSDPALAQVTLQTLVCTYNEKDADCCLEDPPCDHPICTQAWLPAVQLPIGPGGRAQKTLTVPCDHVP